MAKIQITRATGLNLISAWKSSGKSRKEYCEEENIPYHRLTYWERVFNKEQSHSNRPPKGNKFIPIKINEGNLHQSGIEIKTPSGYSIKLFETISLNALIQVLK